MTILHRIWSDQRAVIVSTDLILVATVLVIGMIVGLATFRDQLVQEFGDAAIAVGQLNQSYSFAGFTVGPFTSGGVTLGPFTASGSSYTDTTDDCEGEGDPAGEPPACIEICNVAAEPEG